jgi:epoxide hydrolase-like predicted phosphatase
MKNWPDVDYVIFDLGNVLIDIDYNRAMNLMKEALPKRLHQRVDTCYAAEFHKAYERGEMDSPSFRNAFRAYFEQTWSDSEVDYLWNSLLGELPAYRLDLVRRLKSTYQVGILSNTNEIHINAVHALLQSEHGMANFYPLFDRVFYSQEMGLAKPSRAIYQQLLLELGANPSRVLFFDDLLANVEGAAAVGIQAVQVTGPNTIFDFFGDV